MQTEDFINYVTKVCAFIDFPGITRDEQKSILRLTISYMEKLEDACNEIITIAEENTSGTKEEKSERLGEQKSQDGVTLIWSFTDSSTGKVAYVIHKRMSAQEKQGLGMYSDNSDQKFIMPGTELKIIIKGGRTFHIIGIPLKESSFWKRLCIFLGVKK